jgi:hypothetical protein
LLILVASWVGEVGGEYGETAIEVLFAWRMVFTRESEAEGAAPIELN